MDSDDQLNGDLGERAADVSLHMRKSLVDRNRKEFSLAGLLNPKVPLITTEDLRESGISTAQKLWVMILLPGYSADGNSAVIRFSFGPTAHGASGTYYFKKSAGGWGGGLERILLLRIGYIWALLPCWGLLRQGLSGLRDSGGNVNLGCGRKFAGGAFARHIVRTLVRAPDKGGQPVTY